MRFDKCQEFHKPGCRKSSVPRGVSPPAARRHVQQDRLELLLDGLLFVCQFGIQTWKLTRMTYWKTTETYSCYSVWRYSKKLHIHFWLFAVLSLLSDTSYDRTQTPVNNKIRSEPADPLLQLRAEHRTGTRGDLLSQPGQAGRTWRWWSRLFSSSSAASHSSLSGSQNQTTPPPKTTSRWRISSLPSNEIQGNISTVFYLFIYFNAQNAKESSC